MVFVGLFYRVFTFQLVRLYKPAKNTAGPHWQTSLYKPETSKPALSGISKIANPSQLQFGLSGRNVSLLSLRDEMHTDPPLPTSSSSMAALVSSFPLCKQT